MWSRNLFSIRTQLKINKNMQKLDTLDGAEIFGGPKAFRLHLGSKRGFGRRQNQFRLHGFGSSHNNFGARIRRTIRLHDSAHPIQILAHGIGVRFGARFGAHFGASDWSHPTILAPLNLTTHAHPYTCIHTCRRDARGSKYCTPF